MYVKNLEVLHVRKTNAWLLMWFASYFLAVGHIISTSDFLRIMFGQCLLFLLSYLTYIICINKYNGHYYIFLFAKSSLVIACIGILQVLLYYTLGSSWGISHQDSVYGLARPRSFTAEPDWYGLVCAIATIFFFVMYCEKRTVFNNRKKDLFAILLSGLGLAISFTRAAWLSTTVTLLLYLFFGHSSSKRVRKIILYVLIIGGVLLFATSILSPKIFSGIMKRISISSGTDVSYDGGAWDSRIYSINIMMHYIKQHPFTGNGAGSMNYITGNISILNSFGFERLDMVNSGSGNANIIITNLFDVGIFGTAFLLIYFVVLLWKLIKEYNNSRDTLCVITALWIIFCFIDYQFNNGLRQPYLWVMFGFADFLLSTKGTRGISDV